MATRTEDRNQRRRPLSSTGSLGVPTDTQLHDTFPVRTCPNSRREGAVRKERCLGMGMWDESTGP